jgi:hypothetical protein
MQNIEMKVDGTKLTIVVDLTKPGTPSSTGKTKLIASTRGAAPVDYEKLPGLKVQVNVTVPQ